MIRILFGVVIGAVLMLALGVSNVMPGNVSANDDQTAANTSEIHLVKPIRSAIISPLQKTVNETAGTVSGQYLNKLVQTYDLENFPPVTTDGNGLTEILPDIKSVNENAVNLPLIEAGKTIRDEDIAAFYYDFLKKAGFTINPLTGEIP